MELNEHGPLVLVNVTFVRANALRILHEFVFVSESDFDLDIVLCKPVLSSEFSFVLFKASWVLFLDLFLKHRVDLECEVIWNFCSAHWTFVLLAEEDLEAFSAEGVLAWQSNGFNLNLHADSAVSIKSVFNNDLDF